jgi:hypothetical protein
MKIESLHIGMSVRHPQYGLGTVKTISEITADILFTNGKRTVEPAAAGLEPAEAQAAVSGLSVPLKQFIAETLARWKSGFASGGRDVAGQGSAAGSFFPQDRDGQK